MALDAKYVVTSDVDTYFVSKDTANALANGTLTFYRDSARNVPKPIYQLIGTPGNYSYVELPNPITLSTSGTVENANNDNVVIYYYPYDSDGNVDLYYIVCQDQNGVEEFTREAWPNVAEADIVSNKSSSFLNQISNPTFTNIIINQGVATNYVLNTAIDNVIPLGPDWDFVFSGTGTVTVIRNELAGTSNIPSSPPYSLNITVPAGIVKCYLRQRFTKNSGLWASTSTDSPVFLTGSYVARNLTGGTQEVKMYFSDGSASPVPLVILDGTFTTNYTFITGPSVQIPQSLNASFGSNGYVDIYFSLPESSNIEITAIQVLASAQDLENTLGPDFDSSNRNESFQGDYYIPRLNQKQIRSFLTAWDFSTNPYQFFVPGTLFSSTPQYITDQTIGFTTSPTSLIYTNDPITNGLQFNAVGANTAVGILQYLSGAQVRDIITSRLSVNVYAYNNSTSTGIVNTRVYLFRANKNSSVGFIPTLPAIIGTLQTNGTFNLTAANWTEIPRDGLDTAQAKLNSLNLSSDISSSNNDCGFNGWQLTDSSQISNTDKFAIVVTFANVNPFSFTVNSVSLTPGDIPSRPAVQTYEEVLNECQHYYEKSYPSNVPAGANYPASLVFQQVTSVNSGSTSGSGFSSAFSFNFQTVKRVVSPNIHLYNPNSGTIDQVYGRLANGDSPSIPLTGGTSNNISVNFWQATVSDKLVSYDRDSTASSPIIMSANFSSNLGFEANIRFHYVADARFGIV